MLGGSRLNGITGSDKVGIQLGRLKTLVGFTDKRVLVLVLQVIKTLIHGKRREDFIFFVEDPFDISPEIFRDGIITIHQVSVDLKRRVVS